MSDLDSSITRVFVDRLPRKARRVVLGDAQAAQDTLARYAAASRLGVPPAGTEMILIVRSAPLSSPDTIRVLSAHRERDHIEVTVEVRQYMGALFGNEVTAALIEVKLGRPPAGSYTVTVVTMIRRFDRLGGEAEAVAAGRRSVRSRFSVGGGRSAVAPSGKRFL